MQASAMMFIGLARIRRPRGRPDMMSSADPFSVGSYAI